MGVGFWGVVWHRLALPVSGSGKRVCGFLVGFSLVRGGFGYAAWLRVSWVAGWGCCLVLVWRRRLLQGVVVPVQDGGRCLVWCSGSVAGQHLPCPGRVKNDSAAALSKHDPTRPMDWRIPSWVHRVDV